jgi:hypothetical protein
MRLLNVKTREVEDFDGDDVPDYAILSHRWEEEEVTIRNVETESGKTLKGYYKIDMCCKEAASQSLGYIWADTACIDKTSSAELSEAINSMYRWYENARVCYVYLFDVADGDALPFERSNWFTRGWTLQELLAPSELFFFDRAWKNVGTRRDRSEVIAKITNIPVAALSERFIPSEYLIAEKMSWAANRETKRKEDRAYSLLGIFEVNMSMLYGEGDNAFFRLQEEIIKISADQSIFAWNTDAHSRFGMFASSPASFRTEGHNFVHDKTLGLKRGAKSNGYTLSNAGLSITLQMLPWTMDIYVGLLENVSTKSPRSSVAVNDQPNHMRVGFLLHRTPQQCQYRRASLRGHSLVRIRPELVNNGNGIRSRTQELLISREKLYEHANGDIGGLRFGIETIEEVIWTLNGSAHQVHSMEAIRRRDIPPPQPHSPTDFGHIEVVRRCEAPSAHVRGKREDLTIPTGEAGVAGSIRLKPQIGDSVSLWFAFDFDFSPRILVAKIDPSKQLFEYFQSRIEKCRKSSRVTTYESRGILDCIDMISSREDRDRIWKQKGIMVCKPFVAERLPGKNVVYSCKIERMRILLERTNYGYNLTQTIYQ